MNAFPAAKRFTLPLALIALLVGGAAFAADGGGYLGVMLQDLSPSMAKALQLKDQAGVLVSEVVDDSPADKAGLQDGDVVLSFAGKDTPDSGAFIKAVRKTDPGEKVQVMVLRDGKQKSLDVEVGENQGKTWTMALGGDDDVHLDLDTWFDEDGKQFHVFGDKDKVIKMGKGGNLMFIGEDRGYLGVHLDDLGEQLGEYFGVDDGQGALVTEVIEDSPAAKAGLKAGDLIVKVDGRDVASAADLHELMAGTEADQKVEVEVVRKGGRKDFDVTLGELPETAYKQQMKKIIIEGDDDSGPRMMRKFMWKGEGDDERQFDIQKLHSPDGHLKIRRLAPDSGELDELKAELDQLRQELKQLRKDLQKED